MSPSFGYNTMEITELNKTELVRFITQSICECKSKAHFILEFGDERYCIFLNKDDKGYYVTVSETSSKTVQRPVKEIKRHYCFCSRLTVKNIDDIAYYIYSLVSDYFYGIYEVPTLEDTPTLDDTPTLEDDITDTGLSVAGLKYVEEQLKDMSEDSFQMMVDDAMTELLEDKYTMERIYFENYGVKHFVQEELVENLWVNLWHNLVGLTDDALECETREYLKYDEYMDNLLESGAWVMCSNGMGAVHFNEDLPFADGCSRLFELVGEHIAEKEIEKIMREMDDESEAYEFEWGFFSTFFEDRMFSNGNYEQYVKDELKKCTDIAFVIVYEDCLYICTTKAKNGIKNEVKVVA
jgi:hypothetical protein